MFYSDLTRTRDESVVSADDLFSLIDLRLTRLPRWIDQLRKQLLCQRHRSVPCRLVHVPSMARRAAAKEFRQSPPPRTHSIGQRSTGAVRLGDDRRDVNRTHETTAMVESIRAAGQP